MSISNGTNPPISYKIDSGTLTQADWDFLFQILVEEDIRVVLDGITQTLNTDYTVFINGEAGGTITFDASAVATFTVGKIITLFRDLSATRDTSYQSTQRFDPIVVDGDMDRMTLLSGQVNGNFNHLAMRFPTNYPFLNSEGYNLIPETWPNGFALVQTNGTLGFAPIETNSGDPLLRSDLAVQVAPNEGSRLVGHTGQTVYTTLNTQATDIADLQAFPKIAMSVLTGDTAGTFTVSQTYNVASIMKTATGVYKITFTTSVAHSGYTALATPADETISCRLTLASTTEVTFSFFTGAGAPADSKFSAAIFIFGT